MQLREKLLNWDGKTSAYLVDVYNAQKADQGFICKLLELLGDDILQSPATWLLKYALEEGVLFDDAQTYELYDKADGLIPWQARLHLLQIMPMLSVPERLKYRLVAFCRSSTEDENKFVRAWGYNGLYELAAAYDEFRDGLDIVFASAMESEPASVKARLRKIQKNINANWH